MNARRFFFILILIGMSMTACYHEPSLMGTVEDTQKVESLFPLFKELGVDAYWVDNECRYFHYRRGSFSNDTEKDGGCRVWDFPDPVAFDAEADADMDRLIKAIHDAQIAIDYFYIAPPKTLALDAEISKNSFSIGYCNSLYFDPGYKALPSFEPDGADPTLVRAINRDWYEIAC